MRADGRVAGTAVEQVEDLAVRLAGHVVCPALDRETARASAVLL